MNLQKRQLEGGTDRTWRMIRGGGREINQMHCTLYIHKVDRDLRLQKSVKSRKFKIEIVSLLPLNA